MRKKNGTNKVAGVGLEGNGDNRKRQQEKLLVSLDERQSHQVNKSKSTTQRNDNDLPPSSTASDEMEFKNNKNNFKKTWLLILLPMTIALVLAASLIVILILPTLLEVDDKCFNSFQQTNYKLFATKTTYTSAIDHLNQSSPAGSSHYQPSIFGSPGARSSLEELNNLLTISRGCKLRQLHFIGRHAARYPSSKDILQINKHIEAIQNRIEPSKYNSNNNVNSNNSNNSPDAPPTKVCLNPLAEFKSWASPLASDNGNLITDLGIEETRALAERFRAIYPKMFELDQRLAKVEFGVTKELRTAQTALIFKELMASPDSPTTTYNPDGSRLSPPTELPQSIRDTRFLEDFVSKNHAKKLEFHETCKSYHKDDLQLAYNLNLHHENRTKFIAASISKKLKLNKDEFLTKDETDAIYDMCKYDTALQSAGPSKIPSIWCSLFSESQLKFYEYLNDVEKFFKVYGHPNQARSACPVTTDLMKSFKSLLNQQEVANPPEYQAAFYFTHSQVIQKILANLVELESDPAYSVNSIQTNLNMGLAPEVRNWQTSLLSPFSANIAFTVYECPSPPANFGNPRPDIRIITSVNERPILIDGCEEIICPLERILDDAKINKEKRCKLEEICRKKIVTT